MTWPPPHRTRPNKVGATPPLSCGVGDTFWNSAATPGANLFGCTAPNTWTGLGGGGGGNVSASATPVALQVAEWVTGTTIQGVDTTGSGNYVRAVRPALTVQDSTFFVQDNLDNTKQLQIMAGAIATGQTRTATFPDADITVVGTTTAQTLTNKTLALGANPGLTGTMAEFNTAITNANIFPDSGSVGIPNRTSATAATALTSTTVGQILRVTGANAFAFGALDLALPAAVTGILPGGNGGTGNQFFAVTGPLTPLKTFTFPNASAIVLTDQALVTAAQGGTNLNTAPDDNVMVGNGTVWQSKLLPACPDTSGNHLNYRPCHQYLDLWHQWCGGERRARDGDVLDRQCRWHPLRRSEPRPPYHGPAEAYGQRWSQYPSDRRGGHRLCGARRRVRYPVFGHAHECHGPRPPGWRDWGSWPSPMGAPT